MDTLQVFKKVLRNVVRILAGVTVFWCWGASVCVGESSGPGYAAERASKSEGEKPVFELTLGFGVMPDQDSSDSGDVSGGGLSVQLTLADTVDASDPCLSVPVLVITQDHLIAATSGSDAAVDARQIRKLTEGPVAVPEGGFGFFFVAGAGALVLVLRHKRGYMPGTRLSVHGRF